MRHSYIIFGVILFWVMAMWGCEKGGTLTAPSESTITISPDTVTVNNANSSSSINSQYFTITVKDLDGKPLNDVSLSIFFPAAVPNSPGYVQLYDGSTPKDSPFAAITDKNGVYSLRFDYQSGGGLSYKGELEVRSGSNFEKATFEVTSEEGS